MPLKNYAEEQAAPILHRAAVVCRRNCRMPGAARPAPPPNPINLPKISNKILRFIINNYKINIVTIIDNAIKWRISIVNTQLNEMKVTNAQ